MIYKDYIMNILKKEKDSLSVELSKMNKACTKLANEICDKGEELDIFIDLYYKFNTSTYRITYESAQKVMKQMCEYITELNDKADDIETVIKLIQEHD